MSEELLSNDRRVEKYLTPPGLEPLSSRFIAICTADYAICLYVCYAKKRKIVKRKICIKKTNTFTLIAMNFVQDQLKND